MDILKIPFHRHLQIENFQDNDEYIFCMDERPEHLNHLGTIHACAQLALAEASSGEYLRTQFNEIEGKVVPVIRKTEVKYSTPANGSLFSKASFPAGNREDYLKEYKLRGRFIIPVKVEVYNNENKRTLLAVFEWFITNISA